jgi:hypothetical protein
MFGCPLHLFILSPSLQEVDIYYCADRTVLRGRPEIWARGSWNRYQHPECWMPIKMIPSTGGVFKTSQKLKVGPLLYQDKVMCMSCRFLCLIGAHPRYGESGAGGRQDDGYRVFRHGKS